MQIRHTDKLKYIYVTYNIKRKNVKMDDLKRQLQITEEQHNDRKLSLLSEKEMQKLNVRAYKEAYLQFYKTLYTREIYQSFIETGKAPFEPNNDKLKELIQNTYNRISTKPTNIFLTINPRPEITFEELSKVVDKYLTRKFVVGYSYVYEIRKEDFSGLHCHILLKYQNIRPYDLKKNTKNSFKSICMVDNPEILNIKFIEDDVCLEKVNYMLGNKKDSKQSGVKATILWREKNNIKPIYDSTPPLSCRGAEKILIEN